MHIFVSKLVSISAVASKIHLKHLHVRVPVTVLKCLLTAVSRVLVMEIEFYRDDNS